MPLHPYQLQSIPRQVFRAYDIRGIVGQQINEDVFYSLGRALSVRLQELNRHAIFLARDGRLSSDKLSKALAQGLLDSGIDVYDLGEAATPVMYFATHFYEIDSGLIVTGSHNPANYNGLKMVLAGTTLANDEIETLFSINQQGLIVQGEGQSYPQPVLEDYIKRITEEIQLKRPLKVVVDCGNGIGGPIVPVVLKQLGCEVIPLYCEVDGNFPNHHPDPAVEENLKDLRDTVLASKADIGLAFDGDADRLGVVTNQGELIWPDRLMMLYAEEVLQRNVGSTIVYDVKCSSHLALVIESAGGKAKMCPTGHSIVKGVMKQENAALAGEMSGHLFFKDRWYGFDDALYSACRLLEILSRSDLTASEQFKKIPNSINTPEIKIPIHDEIKFSFMENFMHQASFPDAKLILIDGLRVEFPYGWGLLRASNTTPCLVARFEAQDEMGLNNIQTLFKQQLQAIDASLELPF